jgi:hypothetical protein
MSTGTRAFVTPPLPLIAPFERHSPRRQMTRRPLSDIHGAGGVFPDHSAPTSLPLKHSSL